MSEPIPARDERRQQRIRAFAAVHGAMALAGAATLLGGFGFEDPYRSVSLIGLAATIALTAAYGFVFVSAHSPRATVARRAMFSAWVLYTGALLNLHHPAIWSSINGAVWLVTGVSLAALAIVGVASFGAPGERRAWMAAIVSVVVASGARLAWQFGDDPRALLDYAVLFGVAVSLLLSTAVVAYTVVRDLHAAVDESEGLRLTETDLRAQLEVALAAENRASAAKSQFLANMSHELRTPLTAIVGYADLLREELGDGAPLAPDVDAIRTAASHLHRLIDDILDLAKIEAGKVDVLPERLDLDALLTELEGTMRPAARERGVALRVELRAVPPLTTDVTRLRQVLLNLLSNAIKFTPAGFVRLSVSYDVDGVRFEVADTGVGIPANKLAAIFRPFEQVDNSATRRHGGTGLGLAISHRLVEMLGGALNVSSIEGAGSCFSFTLPTSSYSATPLAPPRRVHQPAPP